MANKTATMETDKGAIKFVLYLDDAPITAGNFVELAESGFYDGLMFHRVESGFVIQGGDPLTKDPSKQHMYGTGGSDKKIPLEKTPKLRHDTEGTVAMARSNDPNSASSQFYITLAPTPFLDNPPGYAVFGRVTEGMNVVNSIKKGDRIQSVKITDEA
ncbi:MAG TPA: peptidylprolyl isomerase [Blastocatellia bacterium]|nr:peptidylprolyl isomerase [Blastocatellia bacterium]